jgi:hypothetical protein
MLELSGWGDILRGIVMLYWLAGASLFYFSVKKSSTRIGKVVSGAIVFFIFGFFPLKWQIEHALAVRDHKARLARAEAIFNERCKTAGERIYRTVEGVEGLMLLKQDAVDPYDDEFDLGGVDSYIKIFLQGRDERGYLVEKVPATKSGYAYVDLLDPWDGKRYRYTADMNTPPELIGKTDEKRLVIKREPASGNAPRYGVAYDDITTPEERALWIAGNSLKVVDTLTNEVIAERVGYMIDKALGNDGGARQPWTFARKTPGWSCPHHATEQARTFVEKVLIVKEK